MTGESRPGPQPHVTLPLATLGDRICVLGPSNSGKSTLAGAIARKTGRPAVHLDVLYHLPGTDWEARPSPEFDTLHAAAIQGASWVVDGNYSRLLPARLERATGIILLDASAPLSLFRYVRRSLFRPSRVGALEGGRDSVKWDMLRHIVLTTPGNRKRYAELYSSLQQPKLFLRSARQIDACYAQWGLMR